MGLLCDLVSGLMSSWLPRLIEASWRSIFLFLAAYVVLRLLRVQGARVRHSVYTAVLLGMLMLPFAGPRLPDIPIRIPFGDREWSPAIHRFTGGLLEGNSSPVHFPGREGTAVKRFYSGVRLAFGLTYLAGLLALSARLLAGLVMCRRLRVRSVGVDDPHAARCLVRLGEALSLPRLPALRESRSVLVPVTVGWIRPMVVLPATYRTWDHRKLQAVLAHELAHVRRKDWVIMCLSSINKCVYWHLPPAWWLDGRLAALAEQASDESAVLALGDRREYARALVDVAGDLAGANSRVLWRTLAMTEPKGIAKRVALVLDAKREQVVREKRIVPVMATCSLLYLIAALHLAPISPKRPVFEAPTSDLRLLVEGSQLSLSQAAGLEESLESNPDDLAMRAKLISYYFLNAVRQPRLNHIYWLIDHHPESKAAASRIALVSPRDLPPLHLPGDYGTARLKWIQQAERYGSDPRVLLNAAGFLEMTDPDLAADWRNRVRQMRPNAAL